MMLSAQEWSGSSGGDEDWSNLGIFGGGVIFDGLDVGGESQCRVKDVSRSSLVRHLTSYVLSCSRPFSA